MSTSHRHFLNSGERGRMPYGRHGINRPGATSAAAHARRRAAIGPAKPGNGRSHGAATPEVPGHGHVPAPALCRPCDLCCSAIGVPRPQRRA